MAFDQSVISNLTVTPDGTEILVAWSSTGAAGTVYQVYLGPDLAAETTATFVHLPWPGARVLVNVGAIAAGDSGSTFTSSLPAAPMERATLTWEGGTFLSASIAGYRIYGALSGTVVLPANLLATIPAYAGGIITDGYGHGGYGEGGYGESASDYAWTSDPLAAGTWTFAVVPFDAAGNTAASPATVTATIAAAPLAPAANPVGERLTYVYNATSHVATLSWLASP